MFYNLEKLIEFEKTRNRTVHARITALTFQELPIESIEGRITQGSLNGDGNSAIRRSCSLTMVSDEVNFTDYYWVLNTKFKLEIGLTNIVSNDLPEIVWYEQGIFVISTFNHSNNTNNYTINISGKDKMCLLNGEVSGNIMVQTDFGNIDEVNKQGEMIRRKLPMYDIIKNMVHELAGEPYENIIIKDFPDGGFELLEYRGEKPLYFYSQTNENTEYIGETSILFDNIITNGKTKCIVDQKETILDELDNSVFVPLIATLTEVSIPKKIYIEGSPYYVAKVEYGQTAGYKCTELVYPQAELVANVGETITSVLDKIKKVLGEFEYFYDIQGRFTFQKKPAFLETKYGKPLLDSDIPPEGYGENKYSYIFNEGELITAFNNNPTINNIKNDFAIWGTRTSILGADLPVHLRFAIDVKPTEYTTIAVDNSEVEAYNNRYGTELKGQNSVKYIAADRMIEGESEVYCDWRELIYRMALDYFKYNHLDSFESKVASANPEYYTGKTGYEHYYTDMQGFWRQLYDFPDEAKKTLESIHKRLIEMQEEVKALEKNKESLETLQERKAELDVLQAEYDEQKALCESLFAEGQYKGWKRQVYDSPENLNFWFDFMDNTGSLQQFSVKNIGLRTKSVNDSSVKSIYFRETPSVIFVDSISLDDPTLMGSYKYIQVPKIESLFVQSSQGKSAKTRLDELLYQHTYCAESVTITAIPIYHLQPNTRIYLHDEKTHIDGDYIVSRISYQLSYNGTMSITATKAVESIV